MDRPSDMSLGQIVRDNAQDTPQATFDAVVAAIGLPRKWAVLLRPALLDFCRNRIRVTAAAVEQEFFRAAAGVTRTPSPTGRKQRKTVRVIPMQTVDDFIRSGFARGDGKWVAWGEATVDDHQQRIGMLARNRNVLQQEICQHQLAVTWIRKAGVSCLGEIPGFDTGEFLRESAA